MKCATPLPSRTLSAQVRSLADDNRLRECLYSSFNWKKVVPFARTAAPSDGAILVFQQSECKGNAFSVSGEELRRYAQSSLAHCAVVFCIQIACRCCFVVDVAGCCSGAVFFFLRGVLIQSGT